MSDDQKTIPKQYPFVHEQSDFVEVSPVRPAGECVRVWSRPKGDPDRSLLLTYYRMPEGVSGILSHVWLKSGPWSLITVGGTGRTFYYADSLSEMRFEEILPSGQLLIDDPRNGLAIRQVFTADFDWKKGVPKGKPLSNRASLERQHGGEVWFKSIYQDSTSADSILRLVEEHEGRTLKRVVEIPMKVDASTATS